MENFELEEINSMEISRDIEIISNYREFELERIDCSSFYKFKILSNLNSDQPTKSQELKQESLQ